MSYEDLLVTNSFQNIPSPEKSYVEQRDNRPHYEQLLRGKEIAKRQYGPLNPPFTQEQIIDRRLGVSIPETSPGLDQYIDLSMRDTRKKIKKTIVNLDSRNRVKRATYQTDATVAFDRRQSTRFPEKGSLLYIPGKSPYFYIYILTTEIGDLYNKQCILDGTFTLADQSSLENIGINQDSLLFRSEQNGPILNINRFLYDPTIDNLSTVFIDGQETPIISLQSPPFDPIRQIYRFNVVECMLPTSVVITSLYEGYVFGSSVLIRLISFLKGGYTNSSHYKMSLGRSFSNVYAIRLLSTEIPNTAYTFTGTSITDSIQGRPISTRVNNKLRWIYKNDAVQQFGTSVYAGNLFMKYISYIRGLEATQETHYTNTAPRYQGTSVDTLRLRDSHQFVSQQTATSSTNTDYYISEKYIGQLSNTSVLPPEQAVHNVVFQPHPYLFPQISSTIASPKAYYFSQLIQLPNLSPTTFTVSQVGLYHPSPVSFQWVFTSNRISVGNPFNPFYFTCRIIDTFGQSVHSSQWIGLSSTTQTLADTTTLTVLDCMIERGNIGELLALTMSSFPSPYQVILTQHIAIPPDTLFTWKQHDPTLFDALQRYYTTSYVCPKNRLPLPVSNGPSPTDVPRMILSCERGNTVSYQSSYRNGATLVIPISAIRPEDRDLFSSKRFTYVVFKQGQSSQASHVYGFPITKVDTTLSRDSYLFTLFPANWDISGLDISTTALYPIVCDFQEWNHKLANKLYTSYIEPLSETPVLIEYIVSTNSNNRIRYLAVSPSSANTTYHNEYDICFQSDTLVYSNSYLSELSVQTSLSIGGVYGGAEYKTFFRPGLFTSMPNILYTPNGLSVSSGFSSGYTDPYIEQSADESNVDFSNTYRIPYYGFIALRKNNLQTGLIQSQYSTEYIQKETEPILPTMFPSHQTTSDKLFSPFQWSDPASQTILSSLGEGADSLYTRYPVYEHTIEPGKYNDATFVKYINTELNTIPIIGYDYSEEIFVQPDILHRSPIQQTTQDNTMERRMVVEVDKSIGKIKFTQYKKIFQPSSNQTADTRTVVYLNEGFPYVSLKIPDVSLANHQFIRIEGMSSIDNIDASQFNTNFYVVKPTTYRAVFRQLLPLPKIDYLNSHQNVFPQDSYIRRTVDTLIAPYADYVNASLQRTSTRDLKRTWVTQQYQQDWLESILGKETVSILTGGRLDRESHWNTATLDKQSLKQSFLTEYGKGESYPSFGATPIVSPNQGGAEYVGSAFTNGSRNQRVYNESSVDSTILVQNGLETTFLNNELFMRLTSHETKQHTVIGRIIQLQATTNRDGNIECMYDLFSENGNNFQVGDIVIGLDSQTIGILLPSDYSFGGLPNRDVLDLGMGAYLYHRNQGELQHFFNQLSDTGGNYQLLRHFIQMVSTWTPPEVSLSDHFYIRIPTLPNTSRLNGMLTSNIVVYTPCLFRFLPDGDDNPLSKLGVDLSTLGDTFRYFYDNTVPVENVNIHRSYIIQSDFHDTFIMVDTNTKGQFSVGDTVYFENHTITPAYLKTTQETVFDVVSYQPFWSWLASLEQIYARWSPLDTTWKDYTFGIYPTPETHGPTQQTIPFKNDYVLRKWNTSNDTTYYSSYYGYYTDSSLSADHSFATPTTYYLHVAWNSTSNELTVCKVVYADRTVDLLLALDIQQCYHLEIEDTEHKSILFTHDYGTQRQSGGGIRFVWANTPTTILPTWTPLATKLRLQLKVIRRSVALSANNTYQPLGFFERLMDTYLHSVWNTYSDDIIRANRIFNEYCYNIYKNRILRIKVCPIDSKGFSAELYDPVSYLASPSTDGTTRSVANAYRKLFPYHQWNFLYNYKNNPEGETVTIGGIPYQTYCRPYQTKDKSDVYSLQFLPGMGVYTVSETIYNGNSTKYPYTRYEYSSTFLGYVLDTSIDNRTEYIQKHTTDSSSFAYKSPKDSQYSEYYLYVLLDPALDTAEKVDSIYTLLETQSPASPLHLVFDASASTDHSDYTTEIHRVGYTDSKYPFDYRRTEVNTNYSLSPDESNLTNQLVTTVEQNRWSQTTINNTTNGTITYYEDYTLSTTLHSIDAMMGLNCSNVIIRKPCLNQTLPGYGFQYRMACATMTEPCVKTLVDSNGISHKLFVSGDYDYYYRKELKTKTVSQHRVGLDERQQTEYNLTNYTGIHPESNHNGPTVNPYDRIAHANAIDTNRTDTPYASDKTSHVPFQRTFQSGEYVRLLDIQRTTPMYSSGRSYNQLVKSQQSGQPMTEKTGPSQAIVRVLQGQMVPSLPLSTVIVDPLGSVGINQTLLDIDYVADEMESIAWVPTRLKHCPHPLPLLGNSSTAPDSLSPSSASSPYASFTVLQSYVSVGGGATITYLEIDNKNQYVSQTELNRYFFHSVCVMNTQVVYTHSETGKLTYVASFDQTSEKPQWNVIEEAVFNISKTKIRLRLRNTVYNPLKLANTLIFVPYKAIQIQLLTPHEYRIYISTDDLPWVQQNDSIVYKFGTSSMKTLRVISQPTLDPDTGNNYFTVDSQLPLSEANPTDDYVVILRNPFDSVADPTVDIRYSCQTTQPLYAEGQWYTRIYYSSQHPNTWNLTSYNNQPKVWLDTAQKNPSLYDPRISYRLFCHSMMGIQLPFYPLYREQTKRLNGTWVFDTDYLVAGPMENQYVDTRNPIGTYSVLSSRVPGRYRTPQETLQRYMMGEFDGGNTSTVGDWIEGSYETYPYVVVKGLYMGYGGYIEERHDGDTVQTIFNNDIGWKIEKITELSSRQYLFFKLANEYSELVRPFIGTPSIQVKTRCRIDNLPVDITLQNIELLLQSLETSSDTDLKYYSDFTVFGSSGHLMKRKITSPYNFNPDNYIYMVVPELNHLETVQTDLKTTAFAKIVLPGEMNKVLYNTFIAGSKVYYDTLYNDLNELEVAFVTNDGNLFDFNGYEHSFTLEITEIMDKFEYINASSGNLEY